MQPYSIKDRFKEISSFMGLALLGVAFYIGSKVTPGTPDAFAPLVLNLLGSFGIAMPEPAKAAGLGLDVNALAEAMAKAVAATTKTAVAVFVVLGLAGLTLGACTLTQVADTTSDLAKLCKASVPLVQAAQGSPVLATAAATDNGVILLTYAKASCNADGTVADTLASNATGDTPKWLQDVLLGLQAAAEVAPYVLPLL